MYSRCCIYTLYSQYNRGWCTPLLDTYNYLHLYIEMYCIKYIYNAISYNILEHIEFICHVISMVGVLDYRGDGTVTKSRLRDDKTY